MVKGHLAYDQAHRITIGEKVEGHRYGEKRQGGKSIEGVTRLLLENLLLIILRSPGDPRSPSLSPQSQKS